MKFKNPKIEIHLIPDDDPDNVDWNNPNVRTPYSYCVLDWGDGPTLWHGWNSDEPEGIMPGTEKGSWYNTGICGWAATPEAAFSEALSRYRERVNESQTADKR